MDLRCQYPQNFFEYFIRERILVFGSSECGKSSLIKCLFKSPINQKAITNMVLPGNNIKVESGRIINNEQTNNNLKMKENTKEISNQYFFMNQMANTNIVMRVWDLSMDHLFVFLNPAYERPQLIIAMYDSSYISQLYKIHSTLEIFLKQIPPAQRSFLTVLIIANKIDIEPNQPIPYDMIAWFQINSIQHFYISVKFNKGIDMVRACMLQNIYQKHKKNNLLIHRDLMMRRFFSKFSNSSNNNNSTNTLNNKQKLNEECLFDYNIDYNSLTPLYYYSKSLICDNIDAALQNICECLDDLTNKETKFKLSADRILTL